ncbi:hypothetical protein HHI36_002932 [Cryptolaemus montrouzieri]|uniref:EGF-like domain-containing protein n=1 Tax=Cryptolaemus montrouzieri TaxID=559131 RepID=A0ABD2PCF3_9CUCU
MSIRLQNLHNPSYPIPSILNTKMKALCLSEHCTGFINIHTFISKPEQLRLLTENYSYQIQSRRNGSYYYQFSTTPNIKEVILKIEKLEGADNLNITLRLNYESLPSVTKYVESKTISRSDSELEIPYWLNKDGRYFLELHFDKNNELETSVGFSLNAVSLDQTFRRKNLRASLSNKLNPRLFKSAAIDYYQDKTTGTIEPYTTYKLIKESGSESFLYTFNINHEQENEFMVPIPLNLTEENFSVLKFEIEDIIDTGGTFEFSINFRPQTDSDGRVKFFPESVDQIIVGCLSQDVYEIPSLPRHCSRNGIRNIAPIIINNTVDNSTVLLPFPESGTWYASLKLFCRPCSKCKCYRECSQLLQNCISRCSCDTVNSCSKCSMRCKADVEKQDKCRNCNCDENCEISTGSCNSTVMFDLSSFPCVMGKCGPNGKCQFMVADGYIFSACSCRNKYRGMDCTDDSNATPFWKVVLGQVLLITSNTIMLPCIYIACRRKYFSEAVMYSFVFLFSSFYHACDVSDNSVQFCITTHSSLQFGDFFSALLAIWGTMLAISDLKLKFRAILHVFAAIILAYFTVIDKTGIWIFLVITIPGLAIIGVSWYLKYRKSGKNFIRKRYLKFYFTSGIVVMGIGILIYAFLQTSGNYMYLHSLWHCIVGITVLIVLPQRNTFPPIQNL